MKLNRNIYLKKHINIKNDKSTKSETENKNGIEKYSILINTNNIIVYN